RPCMFGWLGNVLVDAAREAVRTAGAASLVWAGQSERACPDCTCSQHLACPVLHCPPCTLGGAACPYCPEVSCFVVAAGLSGLWLIAGLAGLAAGCCAWAIWGTGLRRVHGRLEVLGTTWVIATPDDDVYPEDIMALGGRPCVQGSMPPAIPADTLLYRFPPLGQLHTNAEWRHMFDDGIATVQMRRAAMGVVESTLERMPKLELFVIVWLCMAGSLALGRLEARPRLGPPPVQMHSCLLQLGRRWPPPPLRWVGRAPLAALGRSAIGGCSGAACFRNQMGQRFRPYSDGVGLLEEPTWKDFAIQGPRTNLRLCKFIRDQGCVPRARTEKWTRDAQIPDNDRVNHEHDSLMEILEWAITHDELDVSALASFELRARRVQLLEEAHTANPTAPRYEGNEYFRAAAVVPQLTSHVALQLQGEGQIQKD
ncbi:unnamed protein product, partial [Prorocentrum cordatum]